MNGALTLGLGVIGTGIGALAGAKFGASKGVQSAAKLLRVPKIGKGAAAVGGIAGGIAGGIVGALIGENIAAELVLDVMSINVNHHLSDYVLDITDVYDG